MKELINKAKQNKILTILSIITIIGLTLGIFTICFLSIDNKLILEKSINKFFSNIKLENINYKDSLFKSITNNFIIDIIIWILGISIIGTIIIPIILLIKSYITSFTFISIIYVFKVKGIFIGTIYIIPHIINLFIVFLLSYYGISFSVYLIKILFKESKYNKKIILINYLKILLLCTISFLVTSIIEVFVIPKLFKILI